EPGVREQVGQVEEDRRLLGDEHAVVREGRHLAHWIDREVLGAALLARGEVEGAQLVARAELVEQGQRGGRAAVGRVEEDEVASVSGARDRLMDHGGVSARRYPRGAGGGL